MKNNSLIILLLLSVVVSNAQHAFFRGTNNYVVPVAATPTISNGLGFDGIDDVVVLNSSLLSANTNELTYELWLKPYQLVGFSALLNHDNWSTGYIHFQFHGNNIGFDINGGNDNVFSYAFNTNTWYHVALVYSSTAGTLKFYVNGLLFDTVTNNSFPSIAGNVPINMGSWTNDRFFNGVIDEVRIWNVARTQSQIQSNMNVELVGTETGLIAYYPFNQGITEGNNTAISNVIDKTPNARNGVLNNFAKTGSTSNFVIGKVNSVIQAPSLITGGLVLNLDAASSTSYSGSGTTWTDLSGNANNGTLVNGPTYNSSNGGNLVFNGSNAYVDVTMTKTASCTFSAWAKTTVSNPNGMLFNAGNDGSGPDLFFSGGFICWNTWDTYANSLGNLPANFANGNWHNYVVVNDAVSNTTKLYFDGVLYGTAAYRSAANTNKLYIGGTTNSYMWNGSIANFQVYNRSLNLSEVQQNFNNLRSRFGL